MKEPAVIAQQAADIKKFTKGTIAEGAPIIPISAQHNYNIDVVVDYMCRFPAPVRDFQSPLQMSIIRSFDVNKPGLPEEDQKGGVVGGTIMRGVLKIGDKVCIRPGF